MNIFPICLRFVFHLFTNSDIPAYAGKNDIFCEALFIKTVYSDLNGDEATSTVWRRQSLNIRGEWTGANPFLHGADLFAQTVTAYRVRAGRHVKTTTRGSVSEWFIVSALKADGPEGSVSSNLTASSIAISYHWLMVPSLLCSCMMRRYMNTRSAFSACNEKALGLFTILPRYKENGNSAVAQMGKSGSLQNY